MSTTINKEEIQKFSRLADEWWDVNGKFKPLHMFNPIRIQYITEVIEKHFKIKKNNNNFLSGLETIANNNSLTQIQLSSAFNNLINNAQNDIVEPLDTALEGGGGSLEAIRQAALDLIQDMNTNKTILESAMDNEDIDKDLKSLTKIMRELKVFGVPTFIYKKERFWGQDRLDYAIDEYNS